MVSVACFRGIFSILSCWISTFLISFNAAILTIAPLKEMRNLSRFNLDLVHKHLLHSVLFMLSLIFEILRNQHLTFKVLSFNMLINHYSVMCRIMSLCLATGNSTTKSLIISDKRDTKGSKLRSQL